MLIMKYIKHGCPNKIDPALYSIKSLIPRMTICRGCIMSNDRVFLPTSLRQTFLHKLHLTHPGMVAMKSIARELVWYPGMDKDIEYLVSNCPNCQQHRPKPPQNSFITWPAPSRPWSQVHIDHFFFENSVCLIEVNAKSNYIEVELVKNTSVEETITALRIIFSHNGLPDVICSDNASALLHTYLLNFFKTTASNTSHRLLFVPHLMDLQREECEL